MGQFLRNHRNLSYFLLTFGWTWILVFGLILSGAVEDVSTPTPAFIIVGLLCNVSPSLSAHLIARATGSTELREGFRKKPCAKTTLLTSLTVPAITALTILISHFSIRSYAPQLTAPLIAVGLIWPLFSSFGEEFGWRGFILPQLLKKHGALKASLILGLIWAVWHIPMDYIAYKDYGPYMIPAFLVTDFINLTLHAIVMTYLYRLSNGSLKLMVLYHFTITAMAILPGAFLKTAAAPSYTVWESLVSVSILAVLVIFLGIRDARANKA